MGLDKELVENQCGASRQESVSKSGALIEDLIDFDDEYYTSPAAKTQYTETSIYKRYANPMGN